MKNYLKENSRFVYSVILIIMIPVLIVANAFWLIRGINAAQLVELESKAMVAETILTNSINVSEHSATTNQAQIEKIIRENQEISEITILTPSTDGFTVLNSTNKQNLGLTFTSEDYINSFATDVPLTSVISDTSKTPNERLLSISAPIKDSSSGQKLALANLKISLANVDRNSQKDTNNYMAILAVTVFLVLLLLVNHFRFFEYAVLFKKLNEIDKMKDDFISTASHEMKTPMATIKGYISMMMDGLVGKFDDKAREHLEKINLNVQRLDLILSETLDVSRLEQGRMQFDLKPYDISTVIKQSIKMYNDQAVSKGLKLIEEKLKQMPQVFIDPDRLQQVTDNLIGNAIKYTQIGQVKISYRIEKNNLLTIIEDTGIGMNEEDRKNLFGKFYRIKNEETVDIPGTGLGLWISREIVRKMDGDILLDSKEHVGSKFIICLPYMKEK